MSERCCAMRSCLFAISLLAVASMAAPALAIDLGAAGNAGAEIGNGLGDVVGGVSGNVDVQVGSGGVSADAGTQGGGQVGGNSGASGQSGGQTGSSGQGGSPGGSQGRSASPGATNNAAQNDADVPLRLPFQLLPDPNPGNVAAVPTPMPDTTGSVRLSPLVARPGTPARVVESCREAIATAASPHGAARVEVVSAGRSARVKGGGVAAPVEARIVYSRNGRLQVRQAEVSCRLNAMGDVVAAL